MSPHHNSSPDPFGGEILQGFLAQALDCNPWAAAQQRTEAAPGKRKHPWQPVRGVGAHLSFAGGLSLAGSVAPAFSARIFLSCSFWASVRTAYSLVFSSASAALIWALRSAIFLPYSP